MIPFLDDLLSDETTISPKLVVALLLKARTAIDILINLANNMQTEDMEDVLEETPCRRMTEDEVKTLIQNVQVNEDGD